MMKKSCYSCLLSFFCCDCPKKEDESAFSSVHNSFIDNESDSLKNNQKLQCYGKVPNSLLGIVELKDYSSSLVKKIVCGKDHCLILFNNNQLGCFGSNENGQLGLEIGNSSYNISKLTMNTIQIPLFERYDIWDIAAGNEFSLVLIGVNLRSILIRLGIPQDEKANYSNSICNSEYNMSVVNVVDIDYEKIPNIAKVYVFEERIMLLTGSNQVYVGGYGFYNNILDDYKLIENFDISIQSIALGRDHCLILDVEGNLYGIGEGKKGELGPKIPTFFDIPRVILTNCFQAKIKKIAVGENHSLILLSNGELFALGDNSFGQCSGYGMNYTMPYKIHLQSKGKIIDIYSGYNHNLCVLSNGEIYTWGDASEGKLGYVTEDKIKQNTPKNIVDLNEKHPSIVCLGKDISVISMHSKEMRRICQALQLYCRILKDNIIMNKQACLLKENIELLNQTDPGPNDCISNASQSNGILPILPTPAIDQQSTMSSRENIINDDEGEFNQKYAIELIEKEIVNTADYETFYSKDNMEMSINKAGSELSSSFPVIKMVYSVNKSDYPSNITIKDLCSYMINPEIRMKWDKSLQKYEIIKQEDNSYILHSILNKPAIFITQRDIVARRIDFFHDNAFYFFSKSIPEDKEEEIVPKLPGVVRINNIFNGYKAYEDKDNYYFLSFTQLDYKMNLPPSMLYITMPTKLLAWYKTLKEAITEDNLRETTHY